MGGKVTEVLRRHYSGCERHGLGPGSQGSISEVAVHSVDSRPVLRIAGKTGTARERSRKISAEFVQRPSARSSAHIADKLIRPARLY